MNFYKALRKHVSKNDQFIVIHSSLISFRLPENEIKWSLLYALKKLMNDGFTIVVPSFTFSFCQTGIFDLANSKSEVGVLGDWFLELNGTHRTKHPIYSVVVGGHRSDELLSATTEECFSEGTIFNIFDTNLTRIIMLACEWKYCTQMHYYEEEFKVPYRYFKEFTGNCIEHNKEQSCRANFYVRDTNINVENDFSPVLEALRANNLIKDSQIGSGYISSLSCRNLARVMRALLTESLYAFVKKPRQIAWEVQHKNIRKNKKPYHIAVLGNSNLDILKNDLLSKYDEYIKDSKAECLVVDFSQLANEILSNGSALYKFEANIIFFVDRLEDICKTAYLDFYPYDKAIAQVNNYISIVEYYIDRTDSPVFIKRFSCPSENIMKTAAFGEPHSITKLAQRCNDKILSLAESKKNVFIFDVLADAIDVDFRLWDLGKIPYSRRFSHAISQKIMGIILAKTGRSIRLMILDLDNTLWGGILGEDGVDGLQLGGDFPGNAYLRFQKIIRSFMDRGIAVAIVSKNDEDIALSAINELPFMEIRQKDLAAYKINWREKSQNIIEISQELGLGLEHMLFVDDNSVEREKVRQNIPDVKIVELPEDPSHYCDVLLKTPYLEVVSLTNEDLNRGKSYVNKRQAAELQSQFDSIEEYLESLSIQVRANRLQNNNLIRAEQLLTKTNQYNATTRRYTQSKLLEMQSKGDVVWVVSVSDDYSEEENVGVIIIKLDNNKSSVYIDSLLLSCRVLGKGIEKAMLYWIALYAKRNNYKKIVGEIIKTKRNRPIRKIYEDNGFSYKAKQWELTDFDKVEFPAWINLVNAKGGVNESPV